jgi:hypothetical protein
MFRGTHRMRFYHNEIVASGHGACYFFSWCPERSEWTRRLPTHSLRCKNGASPRFCFGVGTKYLQLKFFMIL